MSEGTVPEENEVTGQPPVEPPKPPRKETRFNEYGEVRRVPLPSEGEDKEPAFPGAAFNKKGEILHPEPGSQVGRMTASELQSGIKEVKLKRIAEATTLAQLAEVVEELIQEKVFVVPRSEIYQKASKISNNLGFADASREYAVKAEIALQEEESRTQANIDAQDPVQRSWRPGKKPTPGLR